MNNTTRIIAITTLALAFASVSTAVIGAVKKTAAKSASKRVVLGTKQLNGDQAQLGVTYTLGKTDPINVTLDKVEYTVEPVRFGDSVIVPNADQKLLVLHYTLHNCNPAPRGLAWNTLEITAVDSNDTNWRFVQDVAMEATCERCNMTLKPAQKTKVYTAILVPAKALIPKLMFQSADRLVLRYDVRGKVVKLPNPIADPADTTGATALEKVPAQMGTYYTYQELQGKIDSVEFSAKSFKDTPPKKGYLYLIVKGTAKNSLINKRGFTWNTFRPKLVDADGAELYWNQDIFYASKDTPIRSDIEPGQEVRFKWVFEAPEEVELQNLSVIEHSGRAFVYDLSNIKAD